MADCVGAAEDFFGTAAENSEQVSTSRSLNVTGYVGHQLTAADGGSSAGRYYSSVDFGPELVPDGDRVESILLGPNKWPDLADFRRRVQAYDKLIATLSPTRRISDSAKPTSGIDARPTICAAAFPPAPASR